MAKPPKEQDIPKLSEEIYDFQKMEQIVNALNFMRSEAQKTGSEEIASIIDSCFNMVLTTYYLVLRHTSPEDINIVNYEIH